MKKRTVPSVLIGVMLCVGLLSCSPGTSIVVTINSNHAEDGAPSEEGEPSGVQDCLACHKSYEVTEGVDKFGNKVDDPAGMMAAMHRFEGVAPCVSCHAPHPEGEVSGESEWVGGDWPGTLTQAGEKIPRECGFSSLKPSAGLIFEDACLNEACHANAYGEAMAFDDLVERTSGFERNPHVQQHGVVSCGECHKAHRASVMFCAACHSDADVPDGWITPQEEKRLDKGTMR